MFYYLNITGGKSILVSTKLMSIPVYRIVCNRSDNSVMETSNLIHYKKPLLLDYTRQYFGGNFHLFLFLNIFSILYSIRLIGETTLMILFFFVSTSQKLF